MGTFWNETRDQRICWITSMDGLLDDLCRRALSRGLVLEPSAIRRTWTRPPVCSWDGRSMSGLSHAWITSCDSVLLHLLAEVVATTMRAIRCGGSRTQARKSSSKLGAHSGQTQGCSVACPVPEMARISTRPQAQVSRTLWVSATAASKIAATCSSMPRVPSRLTLSLLCPSLF